MPVRHWLIVLALAIIGAALAWAFWDALGGYEGARLADLAAARVPESGVSNPVTAGVSLRLAGHAGAGLPREPVLRLVLGLGVLVFILTGLALALLGPGFLTYPPGLAKGLILGIETAAALAIGATLAAAYVGGYPSAEILGRNDHGGTRP